jgi:hypothetical protein
MSFNQFVYDIPAEILTPPDFPAECVVHFRPHSKWKGEFGFDWLRVGDDTGMFGDTHYAKIMGKYKTSKGKVCNDLNGWEKYTYEVMEKGKKVKKTEPCDFKNSADEKDSTNYENMVKQYFPITYTIHWKVPDAKKTPKKGWKGEKERTEYTYYVPVMTLQKGKTAELNLHVEVEPKKTPPKRIDVKQHQSDGTYLTVSGTVSPANGKYPVTIECTGEFSEFQYVDALAIYEDPESGKEIEKLCGQLRVVPNDQIIDAKIVFIKVTMDIGNGPGEGKITQESKDELNKILLQSYTYIYEIVNESLNLNSTIELGRLIKERSGKFFFNSSDGLHKFFLSKFGDNLKNKGMDETKYDEFIKIFFLDVECKNEIEQDGIVVGTQRTNGSTLYSYKDAMGKVVKAKTIVMFKPNENSNNDNKKETLAHEVFHALSLHHPFVSKDGSQQAPKALYTYKAQETENILDYSHQKGKQRHSTWYWQWRIIWEELGIVISHENCNIIYPNDYEYGTSLA